ncbi:MAG: hypothetical protein ABJH68_03775 [Ilumatobacter sp.]|uniref:hypothetical protein n=1 Tax=Ilumatobacter sp. TaxID=1967498 RepID=UPI003298B3C7
MSASAFQHSAELLVEPGSLRTDFIVPIGSELCAVGVVKVAGGVDRGLFDPYS